MLATASTPPTYNSGLSSSYVPEDGMTAKHIALACSNAADNQYASEPGAIITYEIYKKAGSDFTDPAKPYDNETVHATSTAIALQDTNDLPSAATFYYASCAKDASDNRTLMVGL